MFAAPTRNQRPTGVHAKVSGGACSSAGERPLHTREVTGSIPVTPIVWLSEKRPLTSLHSCFNWYVVSMCERDAEVFEFVPVVAGTSGGRVPACCQRSGTLLAAPGRGLSDRVVLIEKERRLIAVELAKHHSLSWRNHLPGSLHHHLQELDKR